jgi:predicted RNase H-like HicB family nuclease
MIGKGPVMKLQHTIKAVIRLGEESGFIAECVEIPVVTQGATLDAVTQNLQEAVILHLEGENLQDLGLVDNPAILITFEMDLLRATA